jgi:hypothetical protein
VGSDQRENGPSGTSASGSTADAVHLDRQGVTFLGPAESFAMMDVLDQAGFPVRLGGQDQGPGSHGGRSGDPYGAQRGLGGRPGWATKGALPGAAAPLEGGGGKRGLQGRVSQ